MALSAEHLHESACGLQDEDHEINDDFVDVIEEVVTQAKRFGVELDWGAAGCGGCFNVDQEQYDGAVFWVAQGDAWDTVALNYDVDGMTKAELAEVICDVAEECGVPSSWNGVTSKCVILGTSDAYRNIEPGTRVRGDRRTGVVLDTDWLYGDRLSFRLWDQREYDGIGAGGECIAEFEDRDHAKAFLARTFDVDYDDHGHGGPDDWNIDRRRTPGSRDGSNVVLWDGDTKPTVVKTKALEEIDD